MIKKLVTRCLESEWILKQILPIDSGEEHTIHIDKILATGHRRKVLVFRGDRKYVCQLALRRRYSLILSELHKLAQSHAVSLAPVLGVGTCWKSVVPVHYIVLDWVPGVPCNKQVHLNLHQLTDLGRLFGRLHSIEHDQWSVAGIEYPTHFPSLASRQEEWISCIEKLSELEGERAKDVIDRSSAWIYQNSTFLNALPKHNLIHGDPHGNNIVMEGGNFSLIDTDQMRFDFAPFELFRCLLANYNEHNLERQSAFLRGYHEVVDPTIWQLWEKYMLFIAATVFLTGANSKLSQSQALKDRKKQATRFDQARSYWKVFLRLTTKHPEQVGNLKELMMVYNDARR